MFCSKLLYATDYNSAIMLITFSFSARTTLLTENRPGEHLLFNSKLLIYFSCYNLLGRAAVVGIVFKLRGIRIIIKLQYQASVRRHCSACHIAIIQGGKRIVCEVLNVCSIFIFFPALLKGSRMGSVLSFPGSLRGDGLSDDGLSGDGL